MEAEEWGGVNPTPTTWIMPPFFLRNWFALSLPIAVALAWVIPDLGSADGPLKTSISTKAGVALIFLIQGLTLPSTALRQGLALDPNNGLGRYYSGLMFIQIGRPDLAFKIWRRLIDGAAPDAPWLPTLQEQLPNLARLQDKNMKPPPLRVLTPMI